MLKKFFELDTKKEDKSLIATFYFAFFTSGILAIMLGIIVPYIKDEYNIVYTKIGTLQAVNQIGNLIAVLLAGILPYIIGRKKSSVIFAFGVVIGFLLIIFYKEYSILLLAFLMIGMSRGSMTTMGNTVIAEKVKNKVKGLNFLHASFAVGAIISAPIVLFCIKYFSLGWKGGPLVVSILGSVVVFFLITSNLSNEPTKKEKENIANLLFDKSVIINTGILLLYLGAETSIIGWLVIYFQDTGVFSKSVASITPTLLWAMILVGRLLSASVSSKVDKNKYLLFLGALFTASFILLLLNISSVLNIASLLLIGFSMSGIYPTTFATMKNTSSTAVTGMSIAVASIGGILMPVIVGNVADNVGIFAGVAVISIDLILMLILMIIKVMMFSDKNRTFE